MIGFINEKSNNYTKFLILGYVFILGLVVVSALIFLNYENKLFSSVQNYSESISHEKNSDVLLDASTQRSLILAELVSAENNIKVDSLRMEFYKYKTIIGKSFTNLKASDSSFVREEIMKIEPFMEGWLKSQDNIYNLILNGKMQQAKYNLSKLKQRDIYLKLEVLKSGFNLQAQTSFEKYYKSITEMPVLIFMVSVPIMVGLILIALLSVKRLNQFSSGYQKMVDNLEELALSRQQELLLDRNLMHNLSEAVGVFEPDKEFVVFNKKLTALIPKNDRVKELTLWRFLEIVFEKDDVGLIFRNFSKEKGWRGHAKLLNKDNLMMVNISLIKDDSLPNDYMSIVLTDISELKKVQDKLEMTANFDEVTRLPNRRNYNNTIAKLVQSESKKPFQLLYLDLDNFKWINDNYGHKTGDQFLYNFSEGVLRVLNKKHSFFRIGGDEFIVLVEGIDDNLSGVAAAIIQSVKAIKVKNNEIQSVGCSIGIASFPDNNSTAEGLLNCADLAMYHSKNNGKNKYSFFNLKMAEELESLHRIEKDLIKAIQKEEFIVYYQPQYKLNNLELVGAEALLRWPKKERESVVFVSPVEFIPIAEKFGLIKELGEYVFENSIKQIVSWRKLGDKLPKVAVNVSSMQLATKSFTDFAERVMDEYDIEPKMIDIEITESVLMNNLEQDGENNSNSLRWLQKKGFVISIDDFGTGYSSLAYIKNLNVDKIKIDKSFIDDLENSYETKLIVKAIIEMGHNLGLVVLAEGIETDCQLKILQEFGCDEGQGYLFGKAVPSSEFKEAFLL